MGRQLPPYALQIKALRRHLTFTQNELAERLGIVKKIVADWEQGAQEPSARRYVQLAKMADRELALWFLGRIGLERRFLARLVDESKTGEGHDG